MRQPLIALLLASAVSAVPMAALADTKPRPPQQLIDQVQWRLDQYWIDADASKLTLLQLTELHFLLIQRSNFSEKRLRARTIIARGEDN